MSLERFLRYRISLAEDVTPDADVETLYHPWGFTIYRTRFGSRLLDREWELLVQTIRLHVRLSLGLPEQGHGEAESTAAQTLWSLFRLDARSDPIFADKNMDQLRALYVDPSAPGGEGMNTEDLQQARLFLLADRGVFEAIAEGTFIVKCVEADWDSKERIPAGTRSRVQPSYFGWMQMTTQTLVKLWMRLDRDCLEDIAPPLPSSGIVKTWTARDE